MTGRRCSAWTTEFGERVLYRPNNPGHERRNQEDAGWREAIWLGLVPKSNESYLGTAEGVIKADVFRRRAAGERWCKEEVEKIRGSVRSPDPHHPEADAVPIRIHVDVPEVQGEPRARAMEKESRRVYLKKTDYEEHGYTIDCAGCRQVRIVGKSRNHTEACRKIMEEALMGNRCWSRTTS